MHRAAIRSRKCGGLGGVALALLLCCTNLSAQNYGPPRSVAEAHEFLATTFQRYSIAYIVWHVSSVRDIQRGRVEYYGGRDCHSEVGSGRAERAFAVDWSLVSAVAMSGAETLFVSGQLVRASQDPDAGHYADFNLFFPNARVSRSVSNAFEVLRSSCQSRSRFD